MAVSSLKEDEFFKKNSYYSQYFLIKQMLNQPMGIKSNDFCLMKYKLQSFDYKVLN